jgi:inosine-uridine nucleoside N-ribohydrolase
VQMGCHHRADDAMAILFAFQSPELDVIGLTTTYGNVKTTMATNNALHLCELAGREGVPVSQGLLTSLRVLLQFFPDYYPEKVVHSLTSTSCIMLPVSCKFSSKCAIQAYISVAEQEGDLANLIGKSPSLVSNFMLFCIFQYGNFAAAGYRPQGFLFC